MPVPAYYDLLLPLLQYSSDGREHYIQEAINELAKFMNLSETDQEELMPNGKQRKLNYRTHWANTYLKKAQLLESTGRGTFKITRRGYDGLNLNPSHLDKNYLMRFPEFVDFAMPSDKSLDDAGTSESYVDSEQTPKELIHSVYQGIRKELAEELLEYVLTSTPAFFEQLVVELLLAMGYGGSLQDAGKAIGRTGDGGLDGYIQEDKLGLDIIYIQAKRWALDNSVGHRDVRDFVGGLTGAGATKGVFITTSKFTSNAIEYANNMRSPKVVLIDGAQLAQLMIEHDIGVSVEATYVVKKVDRDYFDVD